MAIHQLAEFCFLDGYPFWTRAERRQFAADTRGNLLADFRGLPPAWISRPENITIDGGLKKKFA